VSRGDPRQIVRAGYDACGPRYNEARVRDPSPELALLIDRLPAGARLLDIGCGGGIPVTEALVERVPGARVIGVDLSPVQIDEARRRVPRAELRVGDIMDQEFAPGSFDAIVCFYTLFHLPREEHRPLLERIAGWLRPGGYALLTVGRTSHPGYTEPDFFGVVMYWSHFDASWYVGAMQEVGFEILARGIQGHGYRDVPGLAPERHPVVFGRLRSGSEP
jgi:SAM-dependent methyltransferase